MKRILPITFFLLFPVVSLAQCPTGDAFCSSKPMPTCALTPNAQPCQREEKIVRESKTKAQVVEKSVPVASAPIHDDNKNNLVNRNIIVIKNYPEDSKRTQSTADREPIVKTKTVYKDRVVYRQKKKNAVLGMIGSGPTVVRTVIDDTRAETSTKQQLVYGVQYQRHFDEGILAGFSVLSNTTATVNLGIEF